MCSQIIRADQFESKCIGTIHKRIGENGKDSSFMVFGDKDYYVNCITSDIDGKLNELIKDVDPTDDLVCGGTALWDHPMVQLQDRESATVG